MSFFSEDFKIKSENERREGIIAAINHQIDYLRRKIAHESELARENARLQESVRDCETKIVGLTRLVTELRDFAGNWSDFLSLVRKDYVSYMSFNHFHEKDTALVLLFLATQSYSDVNKIFDNHEKGFGQPAEPIKFQFFSSPVQLQPARFVQPQDSAPELAQKQKPVDMQKVIDTKREIKSYIEELKVEVLRKRFNPFVGYIAKSKLKLFEQLDQKIQDAHNWEDVRDQVWTLYNDHKKALSAGTHQKSRAMGLVTNILKNQPERGQTCDDYALTSADLSFISTPH